jgi:hypothetical protein
MQEAVDELIINPSGMLTITPNENKYNKVKDSLNRNPQSQIGRSYLAHIPINKTFKVFR